MPASVLNIASVLDFPPEPTDVPAAARGAGILPIRYEDIAEDGRLVLDAIPQALGAVLWLNLIAGHPITTAARASGVLPILTRLTVEGFGGPIAVGHALRGEGTWRLAHTVDAEGDAERIVLDMWVAVEGKKGRTYGPRPADAGDPVPLGRVHARHVLSRLFAPPGQRKVRRLDVPGIEPVPGPRTEWRPPERLLDLPDGATPLEPELDADVAPIELGLAHTDSNRHVNSLVYPRLFEEAVLRRLARLGKPTKLLSRFVDLGYRKPLFAGERARILLRAFQMGDHFGAVGAFVAEPGDGRPTTFVRMVLSP